MSPQQRTIAFFCAMSLTLGISILNFEHPEYVNNETAYLFIGLGLLLLIVFIISKIRSLH